MAKHHVYTLEQLAWLNIRPHLTRPKLTEMFNLRWGTNLTTDAIKGACLRNGIKTGRSGQFVKGQLRVDGSGAKSATPTSFKKGNSPHNRNPIGHVRYCTKDGYMSVKITDTRVTRVDYIAMNRLVWEHYHGPIPPKHIIAFLNGDIYDFRIENLELVSRGEHAVRCKAGYYKYPPELRPQLDAVIKLKRAISKRSKRESG